jgi:WD40 repeat protein
VSVLFLTRRAARKKACTQKCLEPLDLTGPVGRYSTPDRQPLWKPGHNYRSWQVGSWQPGSLWLPRPHASIPGPLAFSPDGKVLALAPSPREMRLVDAATGEEVATLPMPGSLLPNWLCFSADGHRLAISAENNAVQVWDLQSLRRELAKMQLDR